MSCAVAVAAVVTIASCGSDATTEPEGGDLSAEQLQSMTSALSVILGLALGHPQASFASPAHVAANRVMTATLPITGSLGCPEGGHVGTEGTFSIDDDGNNVFALTDTLVACGVHDNHSNLWTFTSKPTLAVTIEQPTNIHGDTIDLAHAILIQSDVGTVAYTTGTLSGTCPLDVTITLDFTHGTPTPDSTTVSRSTTGMVCGHPVTWDTTTTTYTPPP
jgi:hypothetical protein